MKRLKKALAALFNQISDFVGGKGGSDSIFARVIAILKGLFNGTLGKEDEQEEE